MAGRALPFVAALLLAACQGQLGPGDALEGKWLTADSRLVASHHGVEYTARCMHATFDPAALDDKSSFVLHSLTFEQGGNIRPTPGETLELHGTVIGKQLTLQLLFHIPGGPVSDPIGMTMQPGSSDDPLVCNA